MYPSSIAEPATVNHPQSPPAARPLAPAKKSALLHRRLAAARAGLATGLYIVSALGAVGEGVFGWQVGHDLAAYDVRYERAGRVWSCDCPDFEIRGRALGSCKHIYMARLHHAATRHAERLVYRLLVGAAADELASRLPAPLAPRERCRPRASETTPELARAVAALTEALTALPALGPMIRRAVRDGVREAARARPGVHEALTPRG